MAFIIPNAIDTASGARYQALDQAEPDSLDFEIIGNASRSGVIRGCEVTASSPASNTSVAVSSGVVVINGMPYAVAAQTLTLPTSPTDTRFDLVVARGNGASADIVVISGNDDPTNPYFPPSRKSLVIDGDYDNTLHVDLENEVVLAALYRSGLNTVTPQRITDRRMMMHTGIVDQGTTAPLSGYAGVTGSLFYKKGAPTGSSSGVYVKTESSGWIELAQNIGPHVPIGGILAWPMHGSLPLGFVEANGQALSKVEYSALYSVYGDYYNTLNGASDPGTSNFRVPNLSTRILKGTSNTTTGSADSVGRHGGRDSDSLSTSQLPSHTHGLASHTHTLSHSHSIDHDHPGVTSSSDPGHAHGAGTLAATTGGSHAHSDGNYSAEAVGNHSHGSGNLGANSGGSHSHTSGNIGNTGDGSHVHYVDGGQSLSYRFVRQLNSYANSNYRIIDLLYDSTTYGMAIDAVLVTDSGGSHNHSVSGNTSTHNGHGHSVSGNVSDGGGHSHGVAGNSGNHDGHTHSLGGNSGTAGTHSHTVDVAAFTGNSGVASTTTTSTPSTADTGATGTGASVSFLPAVGYVRWIIRASHGTDSATLGGTSLFDEAREEVVTITLADASENVTTGVKASYRLPWGAQLTGVRAGLGHGSTASSSGAISIDILEGGTSVLSTALSIDESETTSTTAATPAVISDPDLADDSLLTFDITSAGTGAVGPLTVTLYLSRDA